MQTIATILPQVDRLCICLNEFDQVPDALRDDPRIETLIPERDLKDAGKFAFEAAPDDFVFTIDDDILFPPDYVARTLRVFDQLDPAQNVLGYQGNALVWKPQLGKLGWRNFLFHKPAPDIIKVDNLGTGTACQIGAVLPRLGAVETAAGFVDQRHSRLHTQAGRNLWVLPRAQDYLRGNLPPDLRDTSLFDTYFRARNPALIAESRMMMAERSAHSGLKLHQFLKRQSKGD